MTPIKRDPDHQNRWLCAGVGYAGYTAFPGLPHLAELEICVRPEQRRRGHGSRLLATVIDALQQTAHTQLVAFCPDQETAAYRFLSAHHFVLEHEERTLTRPLTALPAIQNLSAELHTLPPPVAHPLFRQLYDRSFIGRPWYQPWANDDEVNRACDTIYFLRHADQWIGFAGIKMKATVAQIEPFGIVEAWQGQGFGRALLIALLHQIAQTATAATLTLWHENRPALALYQQHGFVHTDSSYWLTRSLATKTQTRKQV